MTVEKPDQDLNKPNKLPPWAAELPVELADLVDFIRRHNIRGAQVVVTDEGLALAYQPEVDADEVH
jgi:hypothetical protein